MTAERDKLIITVNAGSSSIKIGLFSASRGQQEPTLLARGKLDGIGVQPRVKVVMADGTPVTDTAFAVEQAADLQGAFRLVYLALTSGLRGRKPDLIGHRVVHGGQHFHQPVIVTADILERLQQLQPLAPLHQPHNLAAIQAIAAADPNLPQVACFDTAFHAERPLLSQLFALPYAFYEQGIRRYGFHGLSFEYVADRLQREQPPRHGGRVIIAHLGNGSSLCALHDGKSVEVTTSFTALDGLPMGSRCGSLDPGVLLHLLSQGYTEERLSTLLYQESGLLGLSGVSSDMRQLQQSQEPRAALARDYYAEQISQSVGRLAVTLGGLDALVFTAGIGEKDAALRAKVVERLAPLLGMRLDEQANRDNAEAFHHPESQVALRVIATDEESMIARHAWRLYQGQAAASL